MHKKFILDACCGGRSIWQNKNHPNTIYIDIRQEEKGFIGGKDAYLEVRPDIVMDFRDMEFADKIFKVVVFDPPHLHSIGKNSIFRKKYGCLNPETWQSDLKKGFKECWRVLEDYGVLIFKWSNSEIAFQKVLDLIPEEPLFRQISSNKSTSQTAWFCFMKIPKEETCK